MYAWDARCGRCLDGGRLTTVVFTQSSDGVQQLHTVPNRGNAKLLQGLVRQSRKNRLVYVILAECRLILPEAQAPQPDHNVHDGAHNWGGAHHVPLERVCPARAGSLSACAPLASNPLSIQHTVRYTELSPTR